MPELPEVETIRCGLARKLTGQIFISADSDNRKSINLPIRKYQSLVKGLRIEKVSRRAKLLYFELSKGYKLAIHLKMTGQLIYRHGKKVVIGGHPIKDGDVNLPNKFTHVIFKFKSGDFLYFNDIRKFGWVRLLTNEEFERELARLDYGPEPLSEAFSLEYFCTQVRRYPRKKIKQLLMDQSLIAGLGNIYADEVLFYAGVRPVRRCDKLRPKEVRRIFEAIKKILPKAIECGGSSVASHLDAFGRKGSYAKYHKVYAMYGEPCPKCKTPLQRVTVGGRTSTYCPVCQT